MVKAQIDFAIITAIEIERRAVCLALQMTDEDRVHRETRTYWRKRLPLKKDKDGEFYEIVVAQSPDMAGGERKKVWEVWEVWEVWGDNKL